MRHDRFSRSQKTNDEFGARIDAIAHSVFNYLSRTARLPLVSSKATTRQRLPRPCPLFQTKISVFEKHSTSSTSYRHLLRSPKEAEFSLFDFSLHHQGHEPTRHPSVSAFVLPNTGSSTRALSSPLLSLARTRLALVASHSPREPRNRSLSAQLPIQSRPQPRR
ncbi:hypothetical protein VTH06DRAFT_2190 [Thermothelomyces fergusii]